jgi:hypothetical protein
VRAGDELHYRESQSGAVAAARLVAAAETIERPCAEVLRKAGSVVEHVQLDVLADIDGTELDPSPSVREGVVDEVPERLLDAQRIADKAKLARLGMDFAAERTSTGRKARCDVFEEAIRIDRLGAKRE